MINREKFLQTAGSVLVDTFFQKLATLQKTQPDVWTIFAEQPNFDGRMKHEDGFDPGRGQPGGNIRFRLIKYWMNLSQASSRSMFGGGASGAKRKGEQPAEDDDAEKQKKPRRNAGGGKGKGKRP